MVAFPQRNVHVCCIISLHPDATPSSVASFNDSRCSADGVCSTDPLLFTCELKEVRLLRVILPTGDQEIISLGDSAADVALPGGFQAVFLNVSPIDDAIRNIFLTLSIANASLLRGGEITCDNTVEGVMAGCPLVGKSQQLQGWDCIGISGRAGIV